MASHRSDHSDDLKLPPVATWSASETLRQMSNGVPVVLLDVREVEERRFCVIVAPEAVGDLHIPLGQLPRRVEEIRPATAAATLVVYCHHGIRSLIAARWLSTQGVAPVVNMHGGIEAWANEVDPRLPRY